MQREHYDKEKYLKNVALSRSISGDDATFFAEYQAQKIAEWFPEMQSTALSILDFGCGDGLMTSFVQHIFVRATIYGVDHSAEHIALARELYADINFSVSDAKLPFANSHFDMIYTTEVFHHIPFLNHERYIAELIRVLKPGGTLLLFELNPLNPATVYRFKTNPDEHDAHLMAPWYTRRLLKPYGCPTTRFYDFFPNFLYRLRSLEPYLRWLPCGALYAISIKTNKQ